MISRSNAYLCMGASILLSTLAQVCMKASMVLIAQSMHQGNDLLTSLFDLTVLAWLIVGLGSYASRTQCRLPDVERELCAGLCGGR